MLGVPRELAKHTLNIDLKFKQVKQFLLRFNEERCKAIGEEVARLLAAGFIVEVFHPEWLANLVLVLKKNKQWRMCIDYTTLNKACCFQLLDFFCDELNERAFLFRIQIGTDTKLLG